MVRRGRGLTRWRADNALLLCAAHHVYWTHAPEAWVLYVDSVLGTEAHRALMRDSLADGQIDLAAEWEKAFPRA